MAHDASGQGRSQKSFWVLDFVGKLIWGVFLCILSSYNMSGFIGEGLNPETFP